LLTGGGGGIGLETVKILLYMGAKVIVAEKDNKKIKIAKALLENENLTENVCFYNIDLTSKVQINRMIKCIIKKYSFIDVVFNNATTVFLGEIEKINLKSWEISYKVNLKAPLLLTQKIIPLMKKKNSGVIIFVSSSGAAPYMGAYEIFKTAQVELANTLYAEVENTNISVYTIGPGLVKTETATNAIKIVSAKMGMSIDEFYKMNESYILGKEEAGLGFALSILNSKEYSGQEISSIKVLTDFKINKINDESTKDESTKIDSKIIEIIIKVIESFNEQYIGWINMNVFEKQWVLRHFKKSVEISADECHEKLSHILETIKTSNSIQLEYISLFKKLKGYFEQQYKILQGYEKDLTKLKMHSEYLLRLINNIEQIIKI
jgi:NAD(P)-dependent dehydrogenase (short-subunit alcohol dehydrogenase family)